MELATGTQETTIREEPLTLERVTAHALQGVMVGAGSALLIGVIVFPLYWIVSLSWQIIAYFIFGTGVAACGLTWIVKVSSPRFNLMRELKETKDDLREVMLANQQFAAHDKLREDAYQRLLNENSNLDYRLRQKERTKGMTLREDLYDTPARRDAKRMMEIYYGSPPAERKAPSRETMRQIEHNWTDKRHSAAYNLLRDAGWIVAQNKGKPQFPYQDPQEGYALLATWLKEPASLPDAEPLEV